MIQRYAPRVFLLSAVASLAVAGCSGNSGNSVAPILGGTGTATPTPAASATPVHTATPTAAATATPTSAPGGGVSNLNACQLLASGGTTVPAEPVPGIYSIVEFLGNESAGSFTNVQSQWGAFDVISSPAPSPSPTASPVPTATPSGTTSVSYDVYLGSYNVPSFSIPPADEETAPPGPVEATVGCALVVETVDGSAIGTTGGSGDLRSRNIASESYNTEAIGFPNIGNEGFFGLGASDYIELGQGPITSVTLPLSASGGSGSFTLDAGVTGTITYGPPQVYIGSQSSDIAKLRVKLARATAILNRR